LEDISDSVGLMNSCSTIHAETLFFNTQSYYCQITDRHVLLVKNSNDVIAWASDDKMIKGVVYRESIFLLTVSGAIICLKLMTDHVGDQRLTETNRIQLDFEVACFCALEDPKRYPYFPHFQEYDSYIRNV
jgi:hypothetical protein